MPDDRTVTLVDVALDLRDRDPEYAATLYLLGTPLIAARCRPFVDVAARRIRFDDLLEASRGWSHGEKLLVSAALDMWNGDGETKLGELLHTLDEDNMLHLVEGIGIRRREPLGRSR